MYALYNGRFAESNVAIGYNSMVGAADITGAYYNVAVGNSTMTALTTASRNVAVGHRSMYNLTTGGYSTGCGHNTLEALTSGTGNCALGGHALFKITTGSYNIGIGYFTTSSGGGSSYTGGDSGNIAIGHLGTAGVSNEIRIGTSQTACYVAGVYNRSTGATEHAVYVDNTGKIGKITSSRKVKDDIVDMTGTEVLYDLRPVNFTFKSDETKQRKWGLIAEEVAEILPELATYSDETGDPDGVRYDVLPSLLLKEIQNQQKIISSLLERIEVLEKRSL